MKRHSHLKICCALAAIALGGTVSYAQPPSAPDRDPGQWSRTMVDRALEQARKQHAEGQPRSGVNVDELRKLEGIDPAKLAERYSVVAGANQAEAPTLRVFVSLSMPMKTLTLLGTQVKQAGGELVLRGVVGGLGTRGAWNKTLEALQPVVATGAKIQIDPEAFQRYDIRSVPAFLISEKEQTCNDDQCERTSYVLLGDVSLEFALEEWVGRGGLVGQRAQSYLARLKRDEQ